MRRILQGLLIGMLLLNITTSISVAQAPSTITYQGRLTDVSGNPITTLQTVSFIMYSQPTGGNLLWTETLSVTPDAEGIFTAELGTVSSMTGSLFNGGKRYMTIKIGSDAEMIPRQLMNSTPYAISATNIPNGSVTSEKIATGAVGSTELADGVINSVKLEDNSVTAADLLDEPGLAFKMSLPANSFKALPPSGTDTLASITINAPSAGFVYVWGMANIKLDHINGTRDWLWCQVTQAPDTIDQNAYGMAMIDLPAEMPTNSWYIYPVSVHRAFQVLAAEQITYYFNAKLVSGEGNSDEFNSAQLTAMFFPTSYGTVDQAPPIHDQGALHHEE